MIIEEIIEDLKDFLYHVYGAEALDQGWSNICIEIPRNSSHGDLSTNAAMVLCSIVKQSPLDVAHVVEEFLKKQEYMQSTCVVAPGFVNMTLDPQQWTRVLHTILKEKCRYGTGSRNGLKVNIEYVSANPTGPLHVGHARGAVVGDALGNLMEKAGYQVQKEYYINDGGSQVCAFGRALSFRYLQVCQGLSEQDVEEKINSGEMQYGGDYVLTLAQALWEKYGEDYREIDQHQEFFQSYGTQEIMKMIQEDLALLGIEHHVFTSEKQLQQDGKVAEALAYLESQSLIYKGVLEPPKGKQKGQQQGQQKGQQEDPWERREQLLLKTVDFGDDLDRPLYKKDGELTYFATDIAYHYNKYVRGADILVNVWGADHGGYVRRLEAAVQAMTQKKAVFDVKLCQLVKLMDQGKEVKMSKRSGNFITLRELVNDIGKDSVCFMMLTRKNDAPLTLDYATILEQSNDNIVFYVQYAYARMCSVVKHGKTLWPHRDIEAMDFQKYVFHSVLLSEPLVIEILKKMAIWGNFIKNAARVREVHRIATYLIELAALFHSLWSKGKLSKELKFIDPEKEDDTFQALMFIQALRYVMQSGFEIINVEAKETM